MKAKNTTKKASAAAKRTARLDEVLELATTTARAELGKADNRSSTATATLNVSNTEGATTENTGSTASVTVGTSASTVKNPAKKK